MIRVRATGKLLSQAFGVPRALPFAHAPPGMEAGLQDLQVTLETHYEKRSFSISAEGKENILVYIASACVVLLLSQLFRREPSRAEKFSRLLGQVDFASPASKPSQQCDEERATEQKPVVPAAREWEWTNVAKHLLYELFSFYPAFFSFPCLVWPGVRLRV